MTTGTTSRVLLLLLLPLIAPAYQQRSTIEIVRIIAERGGEQVAPLLGEIRRRNDPGRLYIEGLTATSQTEAIRYFRVLADSIPGNEWSDDALARIAEVLFSTGQREPAEQSVRRLKLEYPFSPYVTTGYFPPGGDSALPVPSRPEGSTSGSEYAVQIGAFAVRTNASRLRDRFAREGYDVTVHENFLDGKNLLYLVWVGRYATMEEALSARQLIQAQHHIDGILRTRSSWRKW